MKRLKIFGYIAGAGIVLIVIVVALAFSSGVQTWAVRKAAAGQKDVKMEVTRVDAGLSGAAVSDLRFEKDGIVITAKGVSAKYSVWDYLRNRQLNAEDVSVDELVVDLRNATRPPAGSTQAPGGATAVAPPSSASMPPTAKPAPFDGLLKQLQLPVDGRVGTLNVKGRALLPDNRTVTFDLKGSRIEAGQTGKLEWTVEFADSTTGAALRSLRNSGTLSLRITTDRRIDLIEMEGSITAIGPQIPADQFKLTAKAEQPAASSNENYSASLGIVRNGNLEPLFKTTAAWTTVAREIAGAWEVGIRSEQLAALLAGLGLPEIAANGAGKFAVKPDTTAATASGSLSARLSQLTKLSPDLAAIGSVDLVTGFDGALADGIARLDKLDLDITAADGRKFAQLGLLQKVSYDLKTQRAILANPGSDAARIALNALPLAWAQPVLKPLLIESGDLSLALGIEAESDGSRVRVKTIEPVTLRSVTIRDAEKKTLVEKTTVTFSPALDYSATKVMAQVAGLKIATPAGDSAAGNVSVEVTNLKTKPVVAFVSQLTAKVVTMHKPFLPVDTGPLDVAIASEGRHEGDTVRVTKSTATITRAAGALLVAQELLQPVELNVKTQKFTFANPNAAAVRLRAGEIPLAWAEPFVAKSKLSGVFAGGTFELSLRSLDDLTFASTEPVILRGITAALDGAALVQSLDITTSLTATKRGNAVAYEVKRFEAKQGDASLATLVAAGEATLGAKFSTTAKGSFEADIPTVTKQPALVGFATLARGRVTATFDANVADATTAKLVVTAKDLVAKQGNQPLGALEANVTVTMKADGRGTIDIPLTLTSGARKSDLAVTGTFGKASDKETIIFDGKIGSANLVVDDFQALAALAPASAPATTPAPTTRPGPTVVRAPRPASPAPVPTGTPAPRDTQAFWKGANGKVEVDLRRVLYGKDAEITAIRGTAVITDSKLSLDSLEGKFKETPFKLVSAVTFATQQPKPYSLTGSVDVNGFDVGAFMRAANPSDDPSVETKVTIGGKFNGTGLNLDDLAQGVYGKFDVAGTKGVLRALGKKSGVGRVVDGVSTVASVATSALALFGKAPPPAAASGGVDLVKALSELAFDQFTMRVERGEDLNLKLTALEFLSPTMHVTGSGGITRSPSAPNAPIQDQPMNIQIQFGAKGGLASLLNVARVLGTNADDKGYTLLRQPFPITGTAANPDASALWKMIATSAVTEGASRLEGLFRKKE